MRAAAVWQKKPALLSVAECTGLMNSIKRLGDWLHHGDRETNAFVPGAALPQEL